MPANIVPLFVFLHIPKTAGTTMRGVFKDMFGAHYHLYDPEADRKPGPDGKFAFEHPGFFDRMLLMAGHFSRFSPVVRAVSGRRIVFVSVVRDPVRRVVSYYDYLRRNPTHPLCQEVKDRTLFQAFAAPGQFRRVCENEQLRILFGTGPNSDPETMLAKFNYIVASSEHLAQLTAAVSGLSGMPGVKKIPHYNTIVEHGGAEIVLAKDQPDFAAAVEAIRTANAAEEAFYQRVQRDMVLNLPDWLPHLPATTLD